MAWQFPISTNTLVNLSTTDSVYVADGILVGTPSGAAISGTGTAHIAKVYGTVISASDTLIMLPAMNSVTTNTLYVGDTGHVISVGSTGLVAVGFYGVGASTTNDGEISSNGFGVFFDSSGVTGTNTVVNRGTIDAGQYGVVFRGDTMATGELKNFGTITGDTFSYGETSASSTTDKIANAGNMIGDIKLDAGNDTYDGRLGHVTGKVLGGDGADKLYGGTEKNVLDGGAGADMLMGGKGADTLTGGADADTFIFKAASESTAIGAGRDTIVDFVKADGDTIDLHLMDANIKQGGNQAFDFIGAQAFHHDAGEVRFVKISGDTYVFADINGDAKSDFSIKIDGLVTLTAGDFVL